MTNFSKYLILPIIILFFTACSETYTPKPRGFFRIDLSEKNYESYSANCGFSFDIPEYSEIERLKGKDSCWFNINYSNYNAKLHLTYLRIEDDLEYYLEDAHKFAFKHEMKASAINMSSVQNSEDRVGNLIYDIKGDVASSLQFFATDSVNHFLRGSLYFNNSPNEDSIAPVLSFLREDVVRLIETLKWNDLK